MMNGQVTTQISKKTLRIIDEPLTPEIFSTKNYDKFKLITGNRKVSIKHVNDLTSVITEVNLLAFNPMIVTRDMQILDGQHRLEVAKNNKLTIYYIIIDKGDIRVVQMLNNVNRHWVIDDYLHSYIAVGLPAYKTFYEYMQKYGVTASNALVILTGGMGGGRNWKTFKKGELKIENEDIVDQFFQSYIKIKPYMESQQAWIDREFTRAFRVLLQTMPVEEFIIKIEQTNTKIDRFVTVKDYLRYFEEIINRTKSKNLTRLF